MKNKNILYPDIAKRIEALVAIDQEMRARSVNSPASLDPSIDQKNTEEMKQIIEQIGWPTISKVGEKGAHNAWLLVQHADHDVAFQRKCLKLMKGENQNEISLRNVAYLEDRVRLNEGEKQIYGTQFIKKNGEVTPRPIKDPAHVNDRREDMGLDTLEAGVRKMNAILHKS